MYTGLLLTIIFIIIQYNIIVRIILFVCMGIDRCRRCSTLYLHVIYNIHYTSSSISIVINKMAFSSIYTWWRTIHNEYFLRRFEMGPTIHLDQLVLFPGFPGGASNSERLALPVCVLECVSVCVCCTALCRQKSSRNFSSS